jgi:hypothetical protein
MLSQSGNAMVADGFKGETPSLRYRSGTRENTQVATPVQFKIEELRKISSDRASNPDLRGSWPHVRQYQRYQVQGWN